MRHREGIAGATLIYGRRQDRPDLLLAAQFLIDDLRQEGRTISGVRLTRHAMRLRADGLELALSLSDKAIPAAAFSGAVRPLAAGAEVDDLARGRVLHALRHHHWVLGLLLRLRGAEAGQSMAARLQALPTACHALCASVAEAAPPLVVIWQQNALVCTLAEFQTLPEGMLDAAGRALMPLGPVGQGRREPARPAFPKHDAPVPLPAPVRPRRSTLRSGTDLPPVDAAPAPGLAAQSSAAGPLAGDRVMVPPTAPLARSGVAPSNEATGSASGTAPRAAHDGAVSAQPGKAGPATSRAARAERQSRGRLFGHAAPGGRVRTAAASNAARADARLAGAIRRAIEPAAPANGRALSRPERAGGGLRVALICLGLALFGPAAASGEDTNTQAATPKAGPKASEH